MNVHTCSSDIFAMYCLHEGMNLKLTYHLGGIVKHMKTKAGPSSKTLENEGDAVKFLNNAEAGIVGKAFKIVVIYC